jgi:hypothetical protein
VTLQSAEESKIALKHMKHFADSKASEENDYFENIEDMKDHKVGLDTISRAIREMKIGVKELK